jgi:cell division protease FtsH
MFVGVGASRVRDLFEQAKQAAPCIVFMDEIDAVGRHRGAASAAATTSASRPSTSCLVEMDGLRAEGQHHPDRGHEPARHPRPGAAAPGPLRPPDRRSTGPTGIGRRKILEVHAKGKPIAPEIELDTLGRRNTRLHRRRPREPRQRGRAARSAPRQEDDRAGGARGGDHARDRRPREEDAAALEEERKITAYHELGHAIVGHYLEHTDEVHKISIISRGQALGYTISLPREDRYLTTKTALMEQLAMTLGGRAAEELVFHEVTTAPQTTWRRSRRSPSR